MASSIDEILGASRHRADLIADLMDEFERLINQKGKELAEYLIKDFLDALDKQNGRLLSKSENVRKIRLIDKAFSKFQSDQGKKIAGRLLQDYKKISAANKGYYGLLSGTGIDVRDIRNIINYRLGISSNGQLLKDGFLQNIAMSAPGKELIKKELYRSIVAGRGYESAKRAIKDLIIGNKDKMGEFERYHRQVTYDTHVQLDRMENAIYAEKLGLEHFIFQGTRRRDSRHFCVQRKGKAFTAEEGEQFKELIDEFIYKKGKIKDKIKVPIGPIVGERHQTTKQKKEAYQWQIDLGGYNCVDIVSYITKDLYLALKK